MHRVDESPLQQSSGGEASLGFPRIAWLVIVAVSLTIILLHIAFDSTEDGQTARKQVDDVMERMEGQVVIGSMAMGFRQSAETSLQQFAVGGVGRRLRGVVLIGEVQGYDAAHAALLRLEVQMDEAGIEPDDDESLVLGLLGRIYSQPAVQGAVPGGLDSTEQAELVDALGWFGEIALHPEQRGSGAARSSWLTKSLTIMILLSVLVLLGIGGLLLGLVLLILVIVFACQRRLRHAFGPGARSDGLLAETFAIWMLVFFAVQYGLGVLFEHVPSLQGSQLLLTGIVQGATALVVFWPVLRGDSWARTRRAIGLTTGPSDAGSFWREIGWGCCGYLMLLPLMLIGILLVLGLTWLVTPAPTGTDFGPGTSPSHPILLFVADGSLWTIVQVYFVASIVAPVLEEILFRGVLYRQLRTATTRWRIGWSVACSTLVVAIVFAAIHPQGLLAIPALAMIAVGLALMREWRGSLLAPIVMHGCSNGVVVTLMVIVTR